MSVGQTSPFESNQDDPKMSDPSTPPPVSSEAPLESSEAEPSAGPSSLLVALILGLFKLVAVGLLVYLTYFFTMTFANRTPPAAPRSEEQKALAKKAEDLRNQGKKLLSSYGWVNPATKSNVRIPIERAMELIAAEAAQPPAPAVVAAPAAGPGPTATTTTAAAARPGGTTGPAATSAPAVASTPVPAAAPPAPAGMPPEQVYRLVCMACHDTDGRGKIVRLAMPSIPDLTDAKWQASRKDSELQHSILEGKDSMINGVKLPLMLPMKDKLAMAHTDVKDMVAFMRGFKDGKQVVSAVPGGAPAPGVPLQVAQGPASAAPAALAPTTSATPATVTQPPVPTTAANATSPAATTAAADRLAGPPPQRPASISNSTPAVAATLTPAPAQPSPAASAGALLPPALPVATGNTAARAERLRAAGATFGTLCIACHGLDGRGTAVRLAMPAIPDFTSRDWQLSRSNSQLATSIMEGKGTLMPPWNTRVTADHARDLVLHVRSFGPPELLAAETETASAPSTVEFDSKMQALRQKFDDLEKQLQALATARPRP